MDRLLVIACGATAWLLAGSCATRRYEHSAGVPFQSEIDQMRQRSAQNAEDIQEVRTGVEAVDARTQSDVNFAGERTATALQHALAADQDAANALTRAARAEQAVAQDEEELKMLAGELSRLDDYQLRTTVTVRFAADRYDLSAESMKQLDELADSLKAAPHYFLAVYGYTDDTGPERRNHVLSEDRARAVAQYLLVQHGVPIYRLQYLGLGDLRPVDTGHTRDAHAKNRRVEVRVYRIGDES